MKVFGRKALLGASFALAVIGSAQAKNYPSRPITAIIPFAGGIAQIDQCRQF